MSWVLLDDSAHTEPVPTWQPLPRSPLPPFDHDTTDPETQAPLPVHTTPIWPVPPGPDLRFWRANAWAVTIPGLPFVTGGSSRAPQQCLTWFLDRWSTVWQARIFETYRQRGYTHLVLSWPDSRDGAEKSISQYVALARRVKTAGFYVHHMLTSKVYDPPDMDVVAYADRTMPVLEALIERYAVDSICVGWELNLFHSPYKLPEIIGWLRELVPAKIPIYVHFSPDHMSWQRPGYDTLAFWEDNAVLTGLLWQANPWASAGMQSARLNDVQVRFAKLAARGLRFDLVAWEVLAARQFDGEVDEDHGDLASYEVWCTPGYPISGYGNGCRRPEGLAL